MRIDKKFAGLLSELFLDIAKAFFIAILVTSSLTSSLPVWESVFLLTKNILSGTLCLYFAWVLAKDKEKE